MKKTVHPLGCFYPLAKLALFVKNFDPKILSHNLSAGRKFLKSPMFLRVSCLSSGMQPLTREQILALIQSNPEATAQLIEALFAELQQLRERVQALEVQLARKSRNNDCNNLQNLN